MELALSEDGQSIRLYELDPIVCQLLKLLIPTANPDQDPQVRARFFPSPTEDIDIEDDFHADWHEYVVPDLEQQFANNLEVVQADLAQLSSQGNSAEKVLEIPLVHLDAWIHGLNQARLALGTRYNIHSDNPSLRNTTDQQQLFRIMQMGIYDFLLHNFVELWSDRG